MPDSQTFSRDIGALIIVYLAGLLLVARRLKQSHKEAWLSLGSPSLLNWGISNSFRLGNFTFSAVATAN